MCKYKVYSSSINPYSFMCLCCAVVIMSNTKDWFKFAKNMKEKRKKAGGNGGNDADKPKCGVASLLVDGEMIVQRLSNIATGKSMKYERIGPQEFASYPDEDLTLENMKRACLEHFKERLIDNDMEADILSSQNGPSCSKLSHLKIYKLIFVRFILASTQNNNNSIAPSVSVLTTLKRARSFSSQPQRSSRRSKDEQRSSSYPKSISISKMLKLGTEISMQLKTPTNVDLIAFDVDLMEWGQPQRVALFIDENQFAEGGFRVVHKAKTAEGKLYVVKRFKQDTLEEMEKVNQVIQKKETELSLAKKAVQMHNVAKSIARARSKNVEQRQIRVNFSV